MLLARKITFCLAIALVCFPGSLSTHELQEWHHQMSTVTSGWFRTCAGRPNGTALVAAISAGYHGMENCLYSRLPQSLQSPSNEQDLVRGITELCPRRTSLLSCVDPLINAVKVCVSDAEKRNLDTLRSIATRVSNFLCSNGMLREISNFNLRDCPTNFASRATRLANKCIGNTRRVLVEMSKALRRKSSVKN